jgi:hypothetical protein
MMSKVRLAKYAWEAASLPFGDFDVIPRSRCRSWLESYEQKEVFTPARS